MNDTVSMTTMIHALRTKLSAKELANAVDTPSAELVRRWGRGEATPVDKYKERIEELYGLFLEEFGENS